MWIYRKKDYIKKKFIIFQTLSSRSYHKLFFLTTYPVVHNFSVKYLPIVLYGQAVFKTLCLVYNIARNAIPLKNIHNPNKCNCYLALVWPLA